jgi:hypothetical protein
VSRAVRPSSLSGVEEAMIDEIEDLFKRQTRAWPQLAQGLEGLARAKTRRVLLDRFDIFVRHIPHRMSSTTASVDWQSVVKRPCFLCTENLPPEEEGVQFGDDFTIYCNPFPIVEQHLTITHRQHRLQRIAGQFGNMLDLAAALRGYFLIYNGPECGASAPDHLHFQAGSRGSLPIAKQTTGQIGDAANYARNVFVFHGPDRSALIDRIDQAIELLVEITGKLAEPLINLMVLYEKGEWFTYLFPRAKHRPQVFYTGELTVSPASIDLCGIFVVPRARDFERITGDAIEAIFREVILPDGQFREVAEKLESKR